jgi:N utilization substance protein A
VASNNSDIDPVGACVGMKGSRVQNVVQELRGEKIDIIPWHVDSAKFVCNALAPAEVSRVIIDEDNNSMEVIVPDEFLSIAIGKKGQNVRLASKLTGWHLDVKRRALTTKPCKAATIRSWRFPAWGSAWLTLSTRRASTPPRKSARPRSRICCKSGDR